jgi:hypothetical protein
MWTHPAMTAISIAAICCLPWQILNWGFGLWWLVIIPALWFASSLLIAMPFMLMRTAAATLSENYGTARAMVAILDLLNYAVVIAATYLGLLYLHRAIF